MEIIAGVLVLVAFTTTVYVVHMRLKKGKWPKLRSPFIWPES